MFSDKVLNARERSDDAYQMALYEFYLKEHPEIDNEHYYIAASNYAHDRRVSVYRKLMDIKGPYEKT